MKKTICKTSRKKQLAYEPEFVIKETFSGPLKLEEIVSELMASTYLKRAKEPISNKDSQQY